MFMQLGCLSPFDAKKTFVHLSWNLTVDAALQASNSRDTLAYIYDAKCQRNVCSYGELKIVIIKNQMYTVFNKQKSR